MNTKNHKNSVVLVAAIGVVALAAAGYFFGGGFRAQYPAQGVSANPYADKPVTNISGTVTKVEEGSITLSVYRPGAAARTVVARISAGTDIFIMVPKESTPDSPLPYKEKKAHLSDVKAGDSVIVAVPLGTKLGADNINAVSVGVLPQ